MPCCLYLSEDSNALAYISVGGEKGARGGGGELREAGAKSTDEGEKRGGMKTGAEDCWEAAKSKGGAKSGCHFAFGLQEGGLGGEYVV